MNIKSVLDCGSGGGSFVSIPRGNVCLDVSIPKSNRPEIFILADIQELPFRDNSFEIASAHNVLEHIVRPDIAVQEMLRVAPVAIITQDRIWSIGAIATPDHLWFQLPGFKFKRFPRTRFGIAFSFFIQEQVFRLMKRPFNVIFREKYQKRLMSRVIMNLLFPRVTYTIRRRKI